MTTHRLLLPLALLACAFAVPSKGEPGLLATLTDGAHAIAAVVPNPNFKLKPDESIDPHLKPDFTATWTGSLNVTKREHYTIRLDGSAGAVTIDGKPVSGAPLDLDIGQHSIEIRFQRTAGPARQELIWSSDDFLPEPIPETVLSHTGTSPAATAAADAEAGRLLVESLNCIGCHRPENSKRLVGRVAPDLTTAGDRLQPAWVAEWLKNPQAFSPNAMMPHVPLTAAQRTDVVAYLSTLKNLENKIKEEANKPHEHVEHGKDLFATVGCTACHAKPDADERAPTKFSLKAIGSKWRTAQLAAYLENPLAIDHSGRMPSMMLNHDDARDLAEYLTDSRDARFEQKPPASSFTTQPATNPNDPAIARGQELVRSQGCLQCHTIEAAKGKPLTATPQAFASLESLRVGQGCLADHPTGRAVDYHLDFDQRRLIVAFIDSVRAAPLISAAPNVDFYHKITTLGCTNCHELNTLKPADDSERIPSLTNVGARLRTDWIRDVLTQRKRVRPWLHRRMPDFGGETVGDLPDLAAAVAGVGDAEPLPKPTREQTLAGQRIVGIGGNGSLGCITCHGFNGAKPQVADDTRGPDITTVAARLRPDHFRRWVYDPKRVNPTTPMPSFFEGTPAHEALGTIDGILQYCALGTAMPPPIGWVDENNYTLAVRDRAMVVRAVMPNPNDVWHNFPRGIAVGLPGLVNYCFDADSCMTRYAWSGGFVDTRAAWSGRGGNQIQVTGKRFWGTDTPPFHVGPPDAPQPKPRFEGYTLDPVGVPTWLYRLGDVEVKETITATDKGFGIVRTFEVEPHGHPVALTLIEHPRDTNMQCTLPSLAMTEVQRDPHKPEKLPALAGELPNESRIVFTVTLSAKEEK